MTTRRIRTWGGLAFALLGVVTLLWTACVPALGPVDPNTPLRIDVKWHVGSRVATVLGHDCVAIRDHVYCNPTCPTALILAHEYKHVEQWAKYDATFPVVYIAHKGRLEREAREYAASHFVAFEPISVALCRAPLKASDLVWQAGGPST